MRLRPLAIAALLAFIGLAIAALTARFDYAPMPEEQTLANPERLPLRAAWDVMGEPIPAERERELLRSDEGRRKLSAANGAVRIDDALLRLGREAFHRETYGNEVFLTDVMGMLDGALTLPSMAIAIAALAGRQTTDLRVKLARDVQVGERLYRAGEVVSTGLHVPKGELAPLGVRLFYDRGRVRMGITCALCHAAVDRETGRVIEGAPNTDLRAGLMMALSANPAAYLVHTGISRLDPYRTDPSRQVETGEDSRETLPDPEALARDVRAMLAAWPPGSFDSSPDLVNNPTSIPSSWTAEGHPYGWSGHAGIGPFKGLSALNNNVHGLNSDTTGQAPAARHLFGLDPETYLAVILQSAPRSEFRFDPARGRRPSRVLAEADPTPAAPGLNHYAALPSYPRANYVTSDSLIAVRPGEPVGRSINGMSAFQNRLRPPGAKTTTSESLGRGREVFGRAGCGGCHGGPAYTTNRVVPVGEVGTEPSRARSFARTEAALAPPKLFAPDIPAPPPPDARLVDVPFPSEGQVKLAWAHGGTEGGYKIPNLLGLAWTAPYLHDGGVAVGPGPAKAPGVAATLLGGVAPDPANSLVALLDREERGRVIAANKASPEARLANVTGGGHAFWVDQAAGFSREDQDALVAFLLSLDQPANAPAASSTAPR